VVAEVVGAVVVLLSILAPPHNGNGGDDDDDDDDDDDAVYLRRNRSTSSSPPILKPGSLNKKERKKLRSRGLHVVKCQLRRVPRQLLLWWSLFNRWFFPPPNRYLPKSLSYLAYTLAELR